LQRRQQWQWHRQTAAATGGAGNGGGRQKQRPRQQWGQTTINQKVAAIALEMAAAATAATERAAAAAALTAANAVADTAALVVECNLKQRVCVFEEGCHLPHGNKYWISAISGSKTSNDLVSVSFVIFFCRTNKNKTWGVYLCNKSNFMKTKIKKWSFCDVYLVWCKPG
jgi:hypothetical protein